MSEIEIEDNQSNNNQKNINSNTYDPTKETNEKFGI